MNNNFDIKENEQLDDIIDGDNHKRSLFSKVISFLDKSKWVIFILVLVIFFIIYAVDSFMNKNKNDIQILYTGYEFVDDSQISNIKETCNYLSKDYNGDGILSIDLLTLIADKNIDYDGKYTYDPNMITRFNTEVNTLSSVIYIVEPSYYDLLLSSGLLLPLTDVFDVLPEGAVDEYGILFESLDISTQDGFNKLSKDALICIRRYSSDKEIRYISEEQYNYNFDFYKKLVEYSIDE